MEEQNLSNQSNQTSQAGPTLVDMQRFQKKRNKTGKKILIILILVAIISAAVYYFFFLNKNNTELTTPENNSNVSKNENKVENKIDKNLDTDQDKLPDYMEKILGTAVDNQDTDGDSYSDFDEIKNGYSPLTSEKYSVEEWELVKLRIKGEDEEFYIKEFETTPEPISFTCGVSTVKDIDNNIYNTVQIGSQCWLKENLKVTKNPAGVAIMRYCYNNDPSICETDGGLYDWNTAMNNSTQEGAQGICPDGWHIPKDSEFNIGGFGDIFAGDRDSNGTFGNRGKDAYFWSSLKSFYGAWARFLYFGDTMMYRESYDKETGFSIRCIKD